jgi:hypothetical protein
MWPILATLSSRRLDDAVSVVAQLEAGQRTNLVSTPYRDERFLSLRNVQTGSDARPVPYVSDTGDSIGDVKGAGL